MARTLQLSEGQYIVKSAWLGFYGLRPRIRPRVSLPVVVRLLSRNFTETKEVRQWHYPIELWYAWTAGRSLSFLWGSKSSLPPADLSTIPSGASPAARDAAPNSARAGTRAPPGKCTPSSAPNAASMPWSLSVLAATGRFTAAIASATPVTAASKRHSSTNI